MRGKGVASTAMTCIMCAAFAGCDAKPHQQQRANSIQPESRLVAMAPDSLLAWGEATYFDGHYDSARTVLDAALASSRARSDSSAAAHALTWLGLTAWRQGRYADARALGEAALRLKLQQRMAHDYFRSYNALGLLAHNEGRLDDAVRLFERANAAARAVGDSVSVAKAIGNLGLVHADRGDYESARASFMALRDAAARADDPRAQGNALANLGMLEVRLGYASAALQPLDSARALYRIAEHPAGEENALGQIGTAYDGMGEPARAIAYLDSALAVARRHDLKQQQVDDLQLIAELYAGLGEHRRALRQLGEAATIGRALGLKRELGNIARAEARSFAAVGRLDLAEQRARVAVAVRDSLGARFDHAVDLLMLAEIAQRRGDNAAASGAVAAALRVGRALDVPVMRAQLALGRARVAEIAGRPQDVLRVLRVLASDADAVRALGPATEWEADALRARAYARLDRWRDAAAAGRRAVAGVERLRGKITPGPLRLAFTSDKALVYSDLVLALLRLGETAEAFEVADAARGRAMLEHIAAAGTSLRRGAARDAAEADRLLRRIDQLVGRLQEADTVPRRERGLRVRSDVAALDQELLRARREYEELFARRSPDPVGAALLGTARVSLARVQSSLGDAEALVEYFVADDQLVTFVVRRAAASVFLATVPAAELVARVRTAREAIRTGEPGNADVALTALHDVLLAPAVRAGVLDGVSVLLVGPHGPLGHVPFAALRSRSGTYVVSQYAVSTIPSAAAFVAMRSSGERRSLASSTVLAPFPERLPGTRLEVRAVRSMNPHVRSYVGASATESALRGALRGSAVVHVATHGVLSETSPMFSRIELAAPRVRSAADDGRLEVHELLAMTVNSDLVFLSGCETGAGTSWANAVARGEDYATLARAFMYAGARDVVATLWRIDDDAAAEFARRFHAAFREASPADAVAAAQRWMVGHPRYSAPRYWAAYTASGRTAKLAQPPPSEVATR